MKLGLQSDMFLQMQMDKNYNFQNDNKKWFNIVSPWDAKEKEQLNRMWTVFIFLLIQGARQTKKHKVND